MGRKEPVLKHMTKGGFTTLDLTRIRIRRDSKPWPNRCGAVGLLHKNSTCRSISVSALRIARKKANPQRVGGCRQVRFRREPHRKYVQKRFHHTGSCL